VTQASRRPVTHHAAHLIVERRHHVERRRHAAHPRAAIRAATRATIREVVAVAQVADQTAATHLAEPVLLRTSLVPKTQTRYGGNSLAINLAINQTRIAAMVAYSLMPYNINNHSVVMILHAPSLVQTS